MISKQALVALFLALASSAALAGDDKVLHLSANGKRITVKAPAALPGDYSFILPPDDGTAGQALVTNGSGTTTWGAASPSIGGPVTGSTAGPVFYGGTGGTLAQTSTFFYDATNGRLGIGTATPGAPIDIGRTTAGETEVLRFTFTPDPGYRNYISSANDGVVGSNYLRFYVKDGPVAGYVSPLVVSDTGVTFYKKPVFTTGVGIGITAAETPLGPLEVSAATTADATHLVLSYTDRNYRNTITGSSSGSDPAANNMKFLVSNGTGAGNQATVMTLQGQGYVGIGTPSPTKPLDVAADTIRLRTPRTPATATEACGQGEISWDASYVYVCVATDTWKRTALASW